MVSYFFLRLAKKVFAIIVGKFLITLSFQHERKLKIYSEKHGEISRRKALKVKGG
jgi:hypothetical protein